MRNMEEYLVICRRHWSFLLARLLLCWVIYRFGVISGDYSWPFYLVALFTAADSLIHHFTDYLAISEKKVVCHQGFIVSSTQSCPVSRVQNVGTKNGLLGKLLGYHTIVVDNAGTGAHEFVFKYAADTELFVDTIYSLIDC